MPRSPHTFQRLLAAALMALGASTLPVRATPVFMDTFATSTLNSNVNAPTGTSTNYVIASSKNATGSTIGADDLKIPIASTSGLAEAQALFTATPISLTTVGDSIEATLVFKNTSGILTTAGAATFLGLFNSGGTAPLTGLNNGGISSTSTTATTGGAAGWAGYVGQIGAASSAKNAVNTRAPQTGSDNRNQDLVGNSLAGGYVSPVATVVGTSTTNANSATVGSVYTQDLLITLSAPDALTITSTLYNGSDTTGTVFGQSSGTTAASQFLTTTFDGVALGYRGTSNPEQYDVSSLTINANSASTPEPTSLALIGVGIAGLVARRRRRPQHA